MYNDNYVKRGGKIIYDKTCNEKYVSDVSKNDHIKSNIQIYFPINFSQNINKKYNYTVRYHVDHIFMYNTCQPTYDIASLPCRPKFMDNGDNSCQPKFINIKITNKHIYGCDKNIRTDMERYAHIYFDVYEYAPTFNKMSMPRLFIDNEKYKLMNKNHIMQNIYGKSIDNYHYSKYCVEYLS
jgi:hypothetical protein